VPNRPDHHYVWVGRFSGLAITLVGVLYALFLIKSVLYTFLLTETLATFVGISVVGGLVWRRANRWGALASLIGALLTNFILYSLTGQALDHWDPNVFLAALLVGIAALVAVSLLTAPEPADAMESFWTRLDTSSDNEAHQPLLLVHLFDLSRIVRERGWAVFREDLGGFAVGCVMVLLLVAATAVFLAL
jgi:Na+/proline symporter